MNEINIMEQIEHPNIISYKEHVYDEERHTFWIIMDYFPGQTLLFFLKESSLLPCQKIKNIMKQILETLIYLSQKSICHRDLTLENIMICPYSYKIKVIDFGVSKQIINDCGLYSPVGKQNYRAPEFFDGGCYNLSYDMWQIGLIFLQMIIRENVSTKKALKIMKEKKLNVEHFIGEQGQNLLLKILEKDPNLRIDCSNALQHSWFDQREEEEKKE